MKMMTSFHHRLSAATRLTQGLEKLREQQSEVAAGVVPHTLMSPLEGELSGDLGLIKPDASVDKVGSHLLCFADVSQGLQAAGCTKGCRRLAAQLQSSRHLCPLSCRFLWARGYLAHKLCCMHQPPKPCCRTPDCALHCLSKQLLPEALPLDSAGTSAFSCSRGQTGG